MTDHNLRRIPMPAVMWLLVTGRADSRKCSRTSGGEHGFSVKKKPLWVELNGAYE
jgi:hypothetical protein